MDVEITLAESLGKVLVESVITESFTLLVLMSLAKDSRLGLDIGSSEDWRSRGGNCGAELRIEFRRRAEDGESEISETADAGPGRLDSGDATGGAGSGFESGTTRGGGGGLEAGSGGSGRSGNGFDVSAERSSEFGLLIARFPKLSKTAPEMAVPAPSNSKSPILSITNLALCAHSPAARTQSVAAQTSSLPPSGKTTSSGPYEGDWWNRSFVACTRSVSFMCMTSLELSKASDLRPSRSHISSIMVKSSWHAETAWCVLFLRSREERDCMCRPIKQAMKPRNESCAARNRWDARFWLLGPPAAAV